MGAKPEVKTFGENKKLVNFSIAVDESYKDKQGVWVNKAQWVDFTAYGENFAPYIERVGEKGLMVTVEGEFKAEKWIDREENERTKTYIKVKEFMPMQPTKKEKKEDDDDTPF